MKFLVDCTNVILTLSNNTKIREVYYNIQNKLAFIIRMTINIGDYIFASPKICFRRIDFDVNILIIIYCSRTPSILSIRGKS